MRIALLILLFLLAPATPLAAQSTDGASAGSFADQFFISRKADPQTEERSIELLGSMIIWFLLGLSVVSIGLIGNLTLANQRKSIVPAEVVAELRRILGAGKFKEAMEFAERDESDVALMLRAALKEAPHGYTAVIRQLEITADELTTNRLRRIELLNVLGQVTPMIGLFGTVYGMILAFQAIVAAGGNAQPALLAGGIGTALTTTFWGLVVAIPALSGYALIRNRIDALTAEAVREAESLLAQFRPRNKGKTGAAVSSSATPS